MVVYGWCVAAVEISSSFARNIQKHQHLTFLELGNGHLYAIQQPHCSFMYEPDCGSMSISRRSRWCMVEFGRVTDGVWWCTVVCDWQHDTKSPNHSVIAAGCCIINIMRAVCCKRCCKQCTAQVLLHHHHAAAIVRLLRQWLRLF
jgi:hypothetical protein